jgi:hypothetical protein
MRYGHVGLVLGTVVLLIGAGPSARPEYTQAKAVAARVLEESRALLEKEVAAKGPAGAIGACAAVALDLARKHEAEGWRVRRVSGKVRNPGDTPEPYEADILGRFEVLKAAGQLRPDSEHVEVVTEHGKPYLRYMRPIVIAGPVCLNCHGPSKELSADVKARLNALYPADQATGYRLNDLRGAVSVKIPLK